MPFLEVNEVNNENKITGTTFLSTPCLMRRWSAPQAPPKESAKSFFRLRTYLCMMLIEADGGAEKGADTPKTPLNNDDKYNFV